MLRMQGIEVGSATAEVKLKEGTFPAGSYVIKRDQPYGRLAKTLLEKQVYPDPVTRTYDDASWTMGMMSHTEVKEISDKAVLDLAVDAGQQRREARRHGHRRGIAVRRGALRLEQHDHAALPPEGSEGAGGGEGVQAGRRHLPRRLVHRQGDAAKVRPAVEALGLTAVGLAAAPQVPMHDLDLPRVAVYSTWGSTQDVGWVRFAFDKFEVPYDLIYKERVREGNLKSAYDVIVIPHQAGSGKRLVFDIDSRGTPIAYKKSEQFKNLGMYGESDDITGGMGLEGVAEFDKFVKAGRRARHARRGELLPGRVRAGAEGRRGADVGAVLLARARSSTPRSCSRRTRSSTATTRRRFRCATAAGRCSACRPGGNPFADGPPPPGRRRRRRAC